jgi:hypothetical protein
MEEGETEHLVSRGKFWNFRVSFQACSPNSPLMYTPFTYGLPSILKFSLNSGVIQRKERSFEIKNVNYRVN